MSLDEDRTPFDWETRFRDDDTPWERGALHPAFLHWRETKAFRPGEHVLIPGCGRSQELLAFAEAGLTVTGADLSETAIAWQSEKFATAGQRGDLVMGDVLAWQPGTPLDLVYEQTFLCAIHPRLRQAYESALTRWLRPGGRLHALFMQKDERGGPPYGCPIDVMHDLFPETRWIWPADDEIKPWPHPRLNGKPELGAVLIRR